MKFLQLDRKSLKGWNKDNMNENGLCPRSLVCKNALGLKLLIVVKRQQAQIYAPKSPVVLVLSNTSKTERKCHAIYIFFVTEIHWGSSLPRCSREVTS